MVRPCDGIQGVDSQSHHTSPSWKSRYCSYHRIHRRYSHQSPGGRRLSIGMHPRILLSAMLTSLEECSNLHLSAQACDRQARSLLQTRGSAFDNVRALLLLTPPLQFCSALPMSTPRPHSLIVDKAVGINEVARLCASTAAAVGRGKRSRRHQVSTRAAMFSRPNPLFAQHSTGESSQEEKDSR